jgi:formylglycine-generating enzyme required for sulfatase activity
MKRILFLILTFCCALIAQAQQLTLPSKSKLDPFQNSLGMYFVPVDGTSVLFSANLTRVKDYDVYIKAVHLKKESPPFKQTPDDPVVMVSWEDAVAFCNWLTQKEASEKVLKPGWRYRLPTDEEWSIAVGIPKKKAKDPMSIMDDNYYPWGTSWPPPRNAGNYGPELNVDPYPYTSPVGKFVPNRFGLYDMGGNVWEWCMDAYNQSADFRILRGSSWRLHNPSDLLAATRVGNQPSIKLDSYGFRMVIDTGISISQPVSNPETSQ